VSKPRSDAVSTAARNKNNTDQIPRFVPDLGELAQPTDPQGHDSVLRRLLNIASIICLVACVALMGLWIRSFYWDDQCICSLSGRHPVYLASEGGRLVLGIITVDTRMNPKRYETSHSRINNWRVARARIDQSIYGGAGFGIVAPTNPSLVVPHWFAVLLAGSLCFVPWRRIMFRFSLRVMLIAVTLVAVVLGMIAWLDRAWIGK
jgi:hypothetical protein